MTLIVEDGSIVENANSYTTLVEIRAFALARGVTLSAVDSEVEVQSTKAMDYLESLRNEYRGSKVSSSQSLQWPRAYVYIDNELFPEDEIPTELKKAQMQLIVDIHNEIELQVSSSDPIIKSEKIGPIFTEYDSNWGSLSTPQITAAKSWLAPLLNKNETSLVAMRV